jgi:hypothetical protein
VHRQVSILSQENKTSLRRVRDQRRVAVPVWKSGRFDGSGRMRFGFDMYIAIWQYIHMGMNVRADRLSLALRRARRSHKTRRPRSSRVRRASWDACLYRGWRKDEADDDD